MLFRSMLCGKPVIAAENRGHRELVEDGVTGYLFPIGDDCALSESLIALYNSGELQSLGQAGYEKAQQYTDANVRKELENVYGLGACR